jgi:hypothetical protein
MKTNINIFIFIILLLMMSLEQKEIKCAMKCVQNSPKASISLKVNGSRNKAL